MVKALRSEGRALEVLLGCRKAPQKYLWRDPIRLHFCFACAANFFYCHGHPWSVSVISSLILCSDFLPQRSHRVTCRCVRSCVIMGKSKKVLVCLLDCFWVFIGYYDVMCFPVKFVDRLGLFWMYSDLLGIVSEAGRFFFRFLCALAMFLISQQGSAGQYCMW